MAKTLITKDLVKSAICPASKAKESYFDTNCKGLVLEVTSSGKKSYYFRYVDARGKTRQPKICDTNDITLTQAQEIVSGYRNQIALGEDPFAKKDELKKVITIADFAMNHYLPFVKIDKRSWGTDESLIRNHVIPNFGKLYLDEFTPQHLFRFMEKQTKTYANGSVNRIVIIMRYMFNLALRWNFAGVKSNPTADVPMLEEHNAKERFLSEEETQRLIFWVNKSPNKMLKYIVPALLYTGSRKREILDLKWSDINFEKQLWRLAESENKTKKVRWVPLSEGMSQLLQSVPRIDGCDWVFANPKTKLPFVSVYESWNTSRTKAGLADVRMHDLRHSFASFLVNAGCSIYEVKELLGHSQIKTTQRYAHLSQDTLMRATNKVSNIMAAANNVEKMAA
ncbi:MAG: site-specific integrase [Gammaproteobacteria bacterium]|nr:site-specific integrase [Gammaproteobacteria bacterium]